MLRTVLEWRVVVAMAIATGVGTWGLHTFPVQSDNVFLALIQTRKPLVFHALTYGYATLWFTTPFLLASVLTSMLAIIVYRHLPATAFRVLPRYPQPDARPAPMLVLGEAHYAAAHGRAPNPGWLTIPQRGLYTGVMILGAVGTGKTSACMYPYADQLLKWRAGDPSLKVGGLVLEVKGDFAAKFAGSWLTRADTTTTLKSGSTAASFTTPFTTISTRTPWPTPWPRW
jgi:hypothetical protein